MTYPEQYAIDQTETNDAPSVLKPMPPLVSLAVDLHEVETSLASLSERMHDLEEQRHRMLDKRQGIRTELADLLRMSDLQAAEAKPARPTF